METSRGIHADRIDAARQRRINRVERHCGGIRLSSCVRADEGHLEATRPGLKLLSRPGAERIGSGEQYAASLTFELMRELGDRGGLACPVDAEDEHDGRRFLGPAERRRARAELLRDDLLERGLIDRKSV